MQNIKPWDYLIVTAANDQQARSYEFQLKRRERTGQLGRVGTYLVIADIDGKRMGSGGSTIQCLAQVLERESGDLALTFDTAQEILRKLRILIVHAGGDSRRLPAYSHCGKMFVPVPAENSGGAATILEPMTLIDRLLPSFLNLPDTSIGQIVVASGDALILFDASDVDLSQAGITALGSNASPDEAADHGVFCLGHGVVTQYLQKPPCSVQAALGAVSADGESVLDLGVMSLDASAAVQLLRTFFTQDRSKNGREQLRWKPESLTTVLSHGIDLYREICCALGTETTFEQYLNSLRSSGSSIDQTTLAEWFHSLHSIPFHLHKLSHCKFLHFGTTRQLIASGNALLAEDGATNPGNVMILNSDVHADIRGENAWIEGCFVGETVALEGFNAVVGVDILSHLELPAGACLDVCAGVGRPRQGREKDEEVWFMRYYHIDDSFKQSAPDGGTFCGVPLQSWLRTMGMEAAEIWTAETSEKERTLWNARVFPAAREQQSFREWLWLFHIESASPEQKERFRSADRYSSAEIAVRVDPARFHERRSALRSTVVA